MWIGCRYEGIHGLRNQIPFRYHRNGPYSRVVVVTLRLHNKTVVTTISLCNRLFQGKISSYHFKSRYEGCIAKTCIVYKYRDTVAIQLSETDVPLELLLGSSHVTPEVWVRSIQNRKVFKMFRICSYELFAKTATGDITVMFLNFKETSA